MEHTSLSIPTFERPQTLAIKLTKNAQRAVKQGHPWIFSDGIAKINKDPNTGDVAVLFDARTNQVMGLGLYDAQSPIRIKVLFNQGRATLDASFFEQQLSAAYALRRPLFNKQTDGYRLLFGENDGFPGLICDCYSKVAVVKLYSAIWLPFLHLILPLIIEQTHCKALVIRLSRSLQKTNVGLSDGQVVYGELDNPTVQFLEHGLTFNANVIKGHKTGYFLDHRHNRLKVGRLSKGKTVLDVFAYAGGFSVHALSNGAKEVTSVDLSEQALALAQENALLNNCDVNHIRVQGDAFEVLQGFIEQSKTFDVVVIDPPSFAKQQSEIKRALQSYKRLVNLGIALTAAKGTLVMASCSSRIEATTFFELVNEQLLASGRTFKLAEQTFHDIDHPIAFKEGAYLKCGYYNFK
ncbi:MAG: class I SAM-dependent rRNA methyltransferase [Gilvibacter sp.]